MIFLDFFLKKIKFFFVANRNSRSSSMTSKQETDSDTQEPSNSSDKSVPDCPPPRQPTPGPPVPLPKKHLSYGDGGETEASALPPPDPWLDSAASPPSTEPAQAGACRRDGHWFLKLLQAETERLEGWCKQMQKETGDNSLCEEGIKHNIKLGGLLVHGNINVAVNVQLWRNWVIL